MKLLKLKSRVVLDLEASTGQASPAAEGKFPAE